LFKYVLKGTFNYFKLVSDTLSWYTNKKSDIKPGYKFDNKEKYIENIWLIKYDNTIHHTKLIKTECYFMHKETYKYYVIYAFYLTENLKALTSKEQHNK